MVAAAGLFRYRIGKRDERGPVGAGSVSAGVLAESDVAIDKRSFDRGEFGGSHIFLAEKFVDRTRAGSGEEHAFGVDPSIAFGRARADEDGARRAESYQFVRVDWQIVPVERAGVLEEVACHPVVFAGRRYVLDEFTPVAAVQLQAAFAGGTDEGDGEALIVGQGDDGGFAVARMAFDADSFGIHGFIGFEVVERAACAPGPGAQCAPIVGLARLAFVDEADDALRQTGAVIGLNAGG